MDNKIIFNETPDAPGGIIGYIEIPVGSFSDRAGYGAPHQYGTAYYESFPDQKAADAK